MSVSVGSCFLGAAVARGLGIEKERDGKGKGRGKGKGKGKGAYAGRAQDFLQAWEIGDPGVEDRD